MRGCLKRSRNKIFTQRRKDATVENQYSILCGVAPLRENNQF